MAERGRSTLISFSANLRAMPNRATQRARHLLCSSPCPPSPPVPSHTLWPLVPRLYHPLHARPGKYMAPPSKYCIMETRLLELHNFVLRRPNIAPRSYLETLRGNSFSSLDRRGWINWTNRTSFSRKSITFSKRGKELIV